MPKAEVVRELLRMARTSNSILRDALASRAQKLRGIPRNVGWAARMPSKARKMFGLVPVASGDSKVSTTSWPSLLPNDRMNSTCVVGWGKSMLTGPEATLITRAGGAVVRGVKQQATTSPEWPSLHASLLELHAILDQWCTAAGQTTRLIEMKLDDEIGLARRTRFRRRYDFGDSVNVIASQCNSFSGRAGEVYAVQIQGSIVSQLAPKVSLVKRLSPEQRRKAARRTLRNMMRVYCPDLLSEFEDATDRRLAWVVANESALMEALAAESADRDSLLAWAEEARRTREGLTTVLGELATLIREKYPMGQQGPMGYQ